MLIQSIHTKKPILNLFNSGTNANNYKIFGNDLSFTQKLHNGNSNKRQRNLNNFHEKLIQNNTSYNKNQISRNLGIKMSKTNELYSSLEQRSMYTCS